MVIKMKFKEQHELFIQETILVSWRLIIDRNQYLDRDKEYNTAS